MKMEIIVHYSLSCMNTRNDLACCIISSKNRKLFAQLPGYQTDKKGKT